jgi:hypothetical protein
MQAQTIAKNLLKLLIPKHSSKQRGRGADATASLWLSGCGDDRGNSSDAPLLGAGRAAPAKRGAEPHRCPQKC